MSATPAELRAANYINLETFKRDGAGVRTPVWFAEEGGTLYVFSAAVGRRGSGKVKRVRNQARARVAACGVFGGLRGEWHEAEARELTAPEAVAAARAALRRKYGWRMGLMDLGRRLGLPEPKRAWLAIELRADH